MRFSAAAAYLVYVAIVHLSDSFWWWYCSSS